eukprot:3941985-Rhodomonas_salina.1
MCNRTAGMPSVDKTVAQNKNSIRTYATARRFLFGVVLRCYISFSDFCYGATDARYTEIVPAPASITLPTCTPSLRPQMYPGTANARSVSTGHRP